MVSRKQDILSLNDVADELGVHYMTAYKYVRQGRLAAEKHGTKWVVSRDDLESFRSPRSKSSRSTAGTPWADRLQARLVVGDSGGAWELVEAMLASGRGPSDVLMHGLVPAMASIGKLWEAGDITVGDEHRASAVAIRLLGRLSPMFARRGPSKGDVIVATAAREMHGLPVAILADIVRSAGYTVVDLGCDVPPDSLAAAARRSDRLRAVMLSATTPGNTRELRKSVNPVREAVPGVPVFVGGSAVDARGAARLGADADGDTALDALALLGAT